MAIQATVSVIYSYTPDGVGPLSVPSAQSYEIVISPVMNQTANLTMPGGNTVTLANLTTLNTQIATGLTAVMTAQPQIVSQISGWTTGNP